MITPDDSGHYLEPECCGNWNVCNCPECIDKREYAQELKYERERDEDEH